MKVGAGPLEAIAVTGDPSFGNVVREVEDDYHVGLDGTGDRPRLRLDLLQPEPARDALIGERRRGEPIAHHDHPLFEIGRDPFFEVNPAILEHEVELLVGIDTTGIVEQPFSELGTSLRATGLARLVDDAAGRLQARDEQVHLGALADSLAALDDDERHAGFSTAVAGRTLRMRLRAPKPESTVMAPPSHSASRTPGNEIDSAPR